MSEVAEGSDKDKLQLFVTFPPESGLTRAAGVESVKSLAIYINCSFCLNLKGSLGPGVALTCVNLENLIIVKLLSHMKKEPRKLSESRNNRDRKI